MSEAYMNNLFALVHMTKSVLLEITMEKEPISEAFMDFAKRINAEVLEVAPEEFVAEAYGRMRLLTTYLTQHLQRGGDDVQLIIMHHPDGVSVTFSKGSTFIMYGLGTDEKTYLLYYTLEERFAIMTRRAVPFLDILSPSEEAARQIRELLSKPPPRQGNH